MFAAVCPEVRSCAQKYRDVRSDVALAQCVSQHTNTKCTTDTKVTQTQQSPLSQWLNQNCMPQSFLY